MFRTAPAEKGFGSTRSPPTHQRTEILHKEALHALEVSGELHVLAGLGDDTRLSEVEDVVDELWRELDDGSVSEDSARESNGANLRPCESGGNVTLQAMQVQGEVNVLAGLGHNTSLSDFHDVVHEFLCEGNDATIDGNDAAASNETNPFPGEADGAGCCHSYHCRHYYLQGTR
ncbi:hypothetical protein E2C01_014619 [Portunus trituberculatus]|uniref:Uncharacterized protein n=1 Tax=Portunus trituberculatus TaxID=210409 RepID=A0A5B7DJQ0_PORTR|nr:hypothetical protein [Portunus trituberculatus]